MGCKKHPVALKTHEFARLEVRDDDDLRPRQLLRLVCLADAGDDLTRPEFAQVKLKPDELLGTFHTFSGGDGRNAQFQIFEFFVGGHGFCYHTRMPGKIKITFLGTGPSGRIPRPGCSRPSCRDARKRGSRSRRLQSSVLIQYNSDAVLFDATQDISKQWTLAKGLKKLSALFISHPHADAMGGVPQLESVLKRIGQPHLYLFAEPETLARINVEFKMPEHVTPYDTAPGQRIAIGPFTVVPFRVEHTHQKEYPTIGFHIRVSDTRIVLMTDVKSVDRWTLQSLKNPDILIMDCAIFEDRFPSHVNFKEARAISGRIGAKRTILTQIGVTWPPYPQARSIVRKTEPHMDISHDGLVIYL